MYRGSLDKWKMFLFRENKLTNENGRKRGKRKNPRVDLGIIYMAEEVNLQRK